MNRFGPYRLQYYSVKYPEQGWNFSTHGPLDNEGDAIAKADRLTYRTHTNEGLLDHLPLLYRVMAWPSREIVHCSTPPSFPESD